jgi:hypothetical protein
MVKIERGGDEALVPNPNLIDVLSNTGLRSIIAMLQNGTYKFNLGRISTFAYTHIINDMVAALSENFMDHSKQLFTIKAVVDQMTIDAQSEGIKPDILYYLDNQGKYNRTDLNEMNVRRALDMKAEPLSISGFEEVLTTGVGDPEKYAMRKEDNDLLNKATKTMFKYDKFAALCITAYRKYEDDGYPMPVDMNSLYEIFS